jgi:hypothetical protein
MPMNCALRHSKTVNLSRRWTPIDADVSCLAARVFRLVIDVFLSAFIGVHRRLRLLCFDSFLRPSAAEMPFVLGSSFPSTGGPDNLRFTQA